MEKKLTTKEAADKLGISTARVRQLVLSGKLRAEKFGRDLMIDEKDLESLGERRAGRPPKAKDKQ